MILVLAFVPGCGVELAVLGAAASAASTGSAVFKQGKLNATVMVPFDEIVRSAEEALGNMGMIITENGGQMRKGTWEMKAETLRRQDVTIRVRRDTAIVTSFQIDVGWFGSETLARLTLKRMAVASDLGDQQTSAEGVY